jgi:hypothetical protein
MLCTTASTVCLPLLLQCDQSNNHVPTGVVLAEKEGKDIAACLGNKKAALLQNHGLLTVGKTIEEVQRPECELELSERRLLTHRLNYRLYSGSSRLRNAVIRN